MFEEAVSQKAADERITRAAEELQRQVRGCSRVASAVIGSADGHLLQLDAIQTRASGLRAVLPQWARLQHSSETTAAALERVATLRGEREVRRTPGLH